MTKDIDKVIKKLLRTEMKRRNDEVKQFNRLCEMVGDMKKDCRKYGITFNFGQPYTVYNDGEEHNYIKVNGVKVYDVVMWHRADGKYGIPKLIAC